jgi:predicted N-acetyltransferase YhbS
MNVQFDIVQEHALDGTQKQELGRLLAEAFDYASEFRTRIYFKQLPQRRIIASEAGHIIGQAGVEHRVIGTESGPASIIGLVDVAVRSTHRRRGLGAKILQYAETLAKDGDVDFMVLFAHDQRLYQRLGYRAADNPLRWVKIHDHTTLGIAEEPVEELMVKEVGTRTWPAGTVDLLGYLF